MTYRNRVDPFGRLHATPARRLFTGNRGVIHDPQTRDLAGRRWTTKAWIICALAYKGRRRDVFGRNGRGGGAGWSELFFLDEVTALAAGHRPCFACRRAAARDFLACFASVSGLAEPKAGELDRRLHRERDLSGTGARSLDPALLANLPDGAMIAIDGRPYALRGGMLLAWDFETYGRPAPVLHARGRDCRLITPATTLAILSAGYRPAWHGSAAPA